MTIWHWLLVVILLILAIPIVVYLSAKLGTVGYLRGRKLFSDLEAEEKSNGSEST